MFLQSAAVVHASFFLASLMPDSQNGDWLRGEQMTDKTAVVIVRVYCVRRAASDVYGFCWPYYVSQSAQSTSPVTDRPTAGHWEEGKKEQSLQLPLFLSFFLFYLLPLAAPLHFILPSLSLPLPSPSLPFPPILCPSLLGQCLPPSSFCIWLPKLCRRR
jgi:hypothetical protein